MASPSRSAWAISAISWAWNSRHSKLASWLIATVMPKMRPCHASSNTSSPFLRGNAAAPFMSAISRLGTVSIDVPLPRGRRGGPRHRHADHRVARDQTRQLGFAQSFGAGGALGEHQVPELGTRVPDANLHALGQVDAEFAQHHAGLAHGARAVLERLVPDRRQADERVRIARAERAHDHVVNARPVLDDLEVDAAEAQLLDGRGAVGKEPLLVRWVEPRPRHDLGAVVRSDVLLVRAHDAVDRVAGDELLFHQQGLERAHAQREDRFGLPVMMAVLVAVVVMGVAHDVLLPGAAPAGSR